MPAPRPSMTAMMAANCGRPSGLASAASRICPTITPSSAPISVAPIAASERNSSVSRMIATPTPISSPTGACGGAEEDDHDHGPEEAALPVLGQVPGDAREQVRHAPQANGAPPLLQGLQVCNN